MVVFLDEKALGKVANVPEFFKMSFLIPFSCFCSGLPNLFGDALLVLALPFKQKTCWISDRIVINNLVAIGAEPNSV